ncbi:MAG: hypothetical protein HC814_04295, partial [Rhodobacteraceae bacterium]|nr:hypothetical protein [Paracoccaceae bacterium]
MARLFAFCFRRHWWVMAAFAAVTLLLIPASLRVGIDVSVDSLPLRQPRTEQYEEIRERFGSDELAVVYAEHPTLFEKDRLESLRRLHDDLARLPFVESVGSLFSYPDIRFVNGALETSPLLQDIPSDPAGLEA